MATLERIAVSALLLLVAVGGGWVWGARGRSATARSLETAQLLLWLTGNIGGGMMLR